MRGKSLIRRKTIFIFVISVTSHAIFATQVPSSMAAIGDSTSTATLAQFHRSRAMSPLTHIKALPEFAELLLSGGNKFALSSWELSWTTGLGSKKVYSHAARLRKFNPQLSISNFAEPGANTMQVWNSQIPKLKKWSQLNLHTNYPDYITLLVGANDICADSLEESTSNSIFIRNYKNILTEILDSSPTTRILAVSLAPYFDLKNSENAFYLAFPGLTTCGSFWKLAPLCKSITHGDEKNTRAVAVKVRQINLSLQSLVTKLRNHYGDRIRLSTKVAERHIVPDDLSVDCFHPNDKAQNDLAELTWASTWWAEQRLKH